MMKRDQVLDTVKNIICKERNNQHGEPENTFPMIAAAWTAYLQDVGLLASDKSIEGYQVAEMMVEFKECRHRMNPTHSDNRLDQIGYLAIAIELRNSAASVAEYETTGDIDPALQYAPPPPQIAKLVNFKNDKNHTDKWCIDLVARCAHGPNEVWQFCEIHQTFIEKFSKGFEYVRVTDKLYYNGKVVAQGNMKEVVLPLPVAKLYPETRLADANFGDWIYDKDFQQVYCKLKNQKLLRHLYTVMQPGNKPTGYVMDYMSMQLYLDGKLIAK